MSERIHSACLWQSDFLIARHMAATQVFSNPTLCLLIDDLGSLEGRQWVWVGMYCRDTYTWAGRCWHPVIRPHDRNNMRRVIISLSFLMVGREILGWPAVVATSILASQRSLSALCQNVCTRSQPHTMHVLWECPSLQNSVHPAIANAQNMKPEVACQSNDYLCFWLRGLLPQTLITKIIPLPCLVSTIPFLGAFPSGPWPGGTFYTDGAGCVHSKWPALRRCDCGSSLCFADASLNVAGFFALPGTPQTVPRVELYAIIVVLLLCRPALAPPSTLNLYLFEGNRC